MKKLLLAILLMAIHFGGNAQTLPMDIATMRAVVAGDFACSTFHCRTKAIEAYEADTLYGLLYRTAVGLSSAGSLQSALNIGNTANNTGGNRSDIELYNNAGEYWGILPFGSSLSYFNSLGIPLIQLYVFGGVGSISVGNGTNMAQIKPTSITAGRVVLLPDEGSGTVVDDELVIHNTHHTIKVYNGGQIAYHDFNGFHCHDLLGADIGFQDIAGVSSFYNTDPISFYKHSIFTSQLSANRNVYMTDESGFNALLDDTVGGSGLNSLLTRYSAGLNIATGNLAATGNYTHAWGGHTTLISNIGSWKMDDASSIHLLNLNGGAPTINSMLFANSTSNAVSIATKEGYVQAFGQYTTGAKTFQIQNGSTNTARFSSLLGTDTWELKLNSISLIKADSTDNSVKISNAYKLPLTDGTSGQVVVTDGAGNCSFATISGSTFTDRKTAQLAATSLAAYTVGLSDESLEVSANLLITSSVNFNIQIQCNYTDEAGTTHTAITNNSNDAGTLLLTLVNGGGAVPYMSIPLHIRAKSGTTVTFSTIGTFTSVTYNFEEAIRKY